jgi:hypothetical protein
MADEVIKEIGDLTDEEKVAAWEAYVRNEVNAALDIYLPKTVSGNIGIKYVPHFISRSEAGDEVDETKADSVGIFVVLDFEEPIDLNKPRVEDTDAE